jgi:hypothetical protein
VAERAKYYDLVPVKRQPTYRRLALEHSGASGKVNECVIVRAHDRSLPLKLKMFSSSNRAQKGFGGAESKEAAQDWDNPKVCLGCMGFVVQEMIWWCIWHPGSGLIVITIE